MTALLWKEYRQGRKVLVAITIFTFLPYLIVLMTLLDRNHAGTKDLAGAAALWSIFLSVAMTAFVAGNAIAGERADRSAEFAAYMPVRRSQALISKAIVAITWPLALYLINATIMYVSSPRGFVSERESAGTYYLNSSVTALLLFGVAWFLSSFAGSAVFAAAGAYGVGILIACGLGMLDVWTNPHSGLVHPSYFRFYPAIAIVFGLTGLVLGTACYLRRVEP